MDRLQSVADNRQRAPDIYRHRVVQVGLLHVVFDIEQRRFVTDRFVAVGLSHLFRISRAELSNLKICQQHEWRSDAHTTMFWRSFSRWRCR